MTDPLTWSIARAAERLRRREVSSLDLTEATLARIDATEDRIHAYVTVRTEEARTTARARDRELAEGRWRGPLHGIPVAIKDLLYMEGTPTAAGSAALAGTPSPSNAAVVERLEEAGAVIIGKTVTHELAYGVNIPPTRSPWGENCYPGGSSAGSGAAVAARSAFGAIGTDTGGSIREPSSLNGLTGLKPTFGRVSRYGVVPLSPSLDHVGPMTRTVTDCALMLQAIAGYDPRDPGSIPEPVPAYLPGIDWPIHGMRLGVDRAFAFSAGIEPDVQEAFRTALQEYEAEGAQIIDITFPEANLMSPVGLTILLAEASQEHGELLRARGDRLDPATRVMLELGELLPGTHYITALRARTLLASLMRRTFDAHGLDALIAPTLPAPTVPIEQMYAPPAGEDPMTDAINASFGANVTGLPALTIPCGFSRQGYPIGLQLTARPFAEGTLFRLAHAYERRHDWTERPPELA